MRTAAIIISAVIAVAIMATGSVGLGILIALACVVYQVILSRGRSSTKSTTPQHALMWDIGRSGVFLIPLAGALLNGLWLVAAATVVVYGVNLMMS
jgi:hypothetical protein